MGLFPRLLVNIKKIKKIFLNSSCVFIFLVCCFKFQFRMCLIQMFKCSAIETAESNMNPTSERATLTQDKRDSQLSVMAVRSTISQRKNGDEHKNCNSFAQLTASGNKICLLQKVDMIINAIQQRVSSLPHLFILKMSSEPLCSVSLTLTLRF